MHLLDTDHITLYQRGDPKVQTAVLARLGGQLAATIISAEEQLRGRMAVVHRANTGAVRVSGYASLHGMLMFYTGVRLFGFDGAAERQYQAIRHHKLRVGTQDLKIAAIALSVGAILVTRNQRDFGQVPGLVIEDWSV